MGDERARAAARRGGGAAATSEARREAKSRLEQLARSVGNDEIARRIGQGNATRDQMLAFVAERLGEVRELQLREVALTRRNANFDWWRTAGDGMRPDHQEPAPTRWRGVAAAYEKAVEALCRGDLRRGQELLDAAMRVEERTR